MKIIGTVEKMNTMGAPIEGSKSYWRILLENDPNIFGKSCDRNHPIGRMNNFTRINGPRSSFRTSSIEGFGFKSTDFKMTY